MFIIVKLLNYLFITTILFVSSNCCISSSTLAFSAPTPLPHISRVFMFQWLRSDTSCQVLFFFSYIHWHFSYSCFVNCHFHPLECLVFYFLIYVKTFCIYSQYELDMSILLAILTPKIFFHLVAFFYSLNSVISWTEVLIFNIQFINLFLLVSGTRSLCQA